MHVVSCIIPKEKRIITVKKRNREDRIQGEPENGKVMEKAKKQGEHD